eukprot:jgi/Ulvmu1/4490/UM002_0216.1
MAKRKNADATPRQHQCADVVRSAYNQLPKHGKPCGEEVTVLAAIVMACQDDSVSVVSLATGTKCVARDKRQGDGKIVHDLHAEVLARRAAVYWVYRQLKHCLDGDVLAAGPFQLDRVNGTFGLRQGYTFHLVVSTPPCGDAAILDEKVRSHEIFQHLDAPVEAGVPVSAGQQSLKTQRTGAKQLLRNATAPGLGQPVHHSQPAMSRAQVPQAHDVDTGKQQHGVLRRKPGKGPPTLSMSCSDKIAKWQLLGWQGSLLSSLLREPLRFTSITCGLLSELQHQPQSTDEVHAVRPSQEAPQSAPAAADGLSLVDSSRCVEVKQKMPVCTEGSRDAEASDAASCPGEAAQRAAVVRAVYARCSDSWQSLTCSWAQRAAATPQSKRCVATQRAQWLLHGWRGMQPDVHVVPAGLGCTSCHLDSAPGARTSNQCICWAAPVPAADGGRLLLPDGRPAGQFEVLLGNRGYPAGSSKRSPQVAFVSRSALFEEYKQLTEAWAARCHGPGPDGGGCTNGTACAANYTHLCSILGTARPFEEHYMAVKKMVARPYLVAWAELLTSPGSLFMCWILKPNAPTAGEASEWAL